MNPAETIEVSQSFIFTTDTWILVTGLFVLMLVFIWIGRKVGMKRIAPGNEGGGTGTSISAMFGLLAFLLAFSFGMSGSRYEQRRSNIVNEANAISTAVLRADLYPEEHRTALRQDFQQYLEARIRYYEAAADIVEVSKAKKRGDDYGKRIWDRTMVLSHSPENYPATILMAPALNQMLDITTTRLIGELSRVPDSIVWMLFLVSLASGFYLGYSSAGRPSIDWLVAVGFCLLTSFVIYITLDLDRPRRGLIRLSVPHQAMLELRKMF